MALAIDGSTPAVAVSTSNTTTTVTSGSFTPPAGSLLLIRWAWNTSASDTPAAPAITDSLGAPLTYTLLEHKTRAAGGAVDGQCAAWWAVVGSSAAMAITVTRGTGTNTQGGALHVTVLTGQDSVTPIGVHGKLGSTSAASIAQSYTAATTGGQGFIVTTDWDLLGAETAGAGCTLTNGGSGNAGPEISYGFLRRSSADDTSGVSNTLNVTIPGTSTNLSWIWVEVVPPGGASTLAGPPAQVVPAAAQLTRNRPAIVTPTIGPPQAIAPAPIAVAAQAQIPQPRLVAVSPAQLPSTTILPLTVSVVAEQFRPAVVTPVVLSPALLPPPAQPPVVYVVPQQCRPPAAPPIAATPTLLPSGAPVPAAPYWINPSSPQPMAAAIVNIAPPMLPQAPAPIVSISARPQPNLAAVIALGPAPLPQGAAPIVVVTSTWQPRTRQAFASQPAFLAAAAPALAPAPIAVASAYAARPGIRPFVLSPAQTATTCTCTTPRPFSGITSRPGSGTTTRPSSGTTPRPCTCT